MTRKTTGFLGIALIASGTWLVSCTTRVVVFNPDGGPAVGPTDNCQSSLDWLPSTPAPALTTPPPHPEGECAFFQTGFQYFLMATQPLPNGDPALTSYATLDDVFARAQPLPAGALAAPGAHRGTALRAWLGNVRQPGGEQILIDRDGRAVFYGTHLNQAFVDFVRAHGLQTATGIQSADANLSFSPGVVAFKSAWKDIDAADGVSDDYSRHITTAAWVPTLHQDPVTKTISEDRDHPRAIRVALLALHLAYALPGHPELIWMTFEHADAMGVRDMAPSTPNNPSYNDPVNAEISAPVSLLDFPLYHAGMPTNIANRPYLETTLSFEDRTQTFLQTTSVYRTFPASRSHTIEENPEVRSLNDNVGALFRAKAAEIDGADHRGAYRLVGGLWMDKPRYFVLDSSLQNDAYSPFVAGPHLDQDGNLVPAVSLSDFATEMKINGTDSPLSILGGHDRLSGVATESFTQPAGSFHNCLTCHNTQAMTANGIPLARDSWATALIQPKLINVSRVFSQFILEECGPTGVCPVP